jgi:hypothetical protein
MSRRALSLALSIFILVLIFAVGLKPTRPSDTLTHSSTTETVTNTATFKKVRDWLDQAPTQVAPVDSEITQLAIARRDSMREVIISNPQLALAEALSWSDYLRLPDALKPYFEKPFNTLGNLFVLPVCGKHAPGTPDVIRTLEIDGQSFAAQVYGRRQEPMTKENTPLSGITLDGLAAIREFPFEQLTSADAKTLAHLPIRNSAPAHDFSTGAPLPDKGTITALAGGKRYLFANEESLDAFNQKLAAFDNEPGPHTGAQVYLADVADGGEDGFDWDAAADAVDDAADAWTETVKNVFFIRADFSDASNSVTQAQLSTVLNVATSDSIAEMSYGKTSINASVSASVIRLPQPTIGYLPGNNDLLYNHAKAAYEAINGAGSLSTYDIIGVHFPSIGIQSSGGLTYGGLAGGSRQWLQGTTSSNVIIHEFGHNYGVGHASYWDTSDGSVVGTGTSSEYGDPYDIMGGGPDPEGHFHMQAKERLDWIDPAQWVDVNASGSGTHRIYRIDDAATTGTLRGMRVTKGASEYYWIGYRTGIPGNTYLQNGAYLVWQRPGFTRSWMLDSTPNSSSSDRDDAALPVGATYSDPIANVYITPTQIGGTGADAWIDINTQIGPFPGNAAPTATLNVPATVAARTPVTISVSASDPNSDTLAYAWNFGDGGASPNAASLSQTWIVGGSYPVTVTVSDMKGGIVVKTTTVTVSDPLDNWTTGSIGSTATVKRLEYLDGRFLATGNSYAHYSLDGQSWQNEYLSANFRSGGIATDGNTFVIAGYDYNFDISDWEAAIYRSSTGSNWQSVSLPTCGQLDDIAYGAGAFIAVGENGTILRSADAGQTWSKQTTPGVPYLRAVEYGNGTFVAVSETSVYTSPYGITWTDRSNGHNLASWKSLKDVTFLNGKFIAGGYRSGVLVSSDLGVTWSQAVILESSEYDIESFAIGNGVIVAAADAVVGTSGGALLVSGDGGYTWKESNYASFPSTETIAFGSGAFITSYDTTGTTLTSDSLYPGNTAPTGGISGPTTGDARAGYVFTTAANDSNGDPLLIFWDFADGTPVVEGSAVNHTFPTSGTFTVTLTITDTLGGITLSTQTITITDPLDSWTKRTSGTTASLSDITLGAGKIVTVGSGNGTYRVSTDALTWTGGTIGTNIYLEGVVYDGAQFIAVGMDYDFAISAWVGVIYTSPNATTWTRRHRAGSPLNSIAFGNGIYVAAGESGSALWSSDAIIWSPAAITGVTQNLNDVSFGNNTFVIVGSAGNGGSHIVLTSSNGSGWSHKSAGSDLASWQGFYTVQYLNDRFLASGWYSKIRHSTNNGNNFYTNLSDSHRTPAFAYGNGIYLAAGENLSNSSVDINLISTDGENWAPLTTTSQDNRTAGIFFNNTFITVGESGAVWQSDPFIAPPVATGFAAWQSAYFPGLPSGSASGDDFDGDGMKNLAEYATGSDPTDPNSMISLTTEIISDSLYVTIPKASGVSDITYAIELSTDLVNWGPGTTGTVIVTNNATTLTARSAATFSNAAKIFMRGVFTLTP